MTLTSDSETGSCGARLASRRDRVSMGSMGTRPVPDPTCPFCTIPDERVILANEHAVAVLDAYPVAPGHTLVLPREHAASIFTLRGEIRDSVWQLVAQVRQYLDERYFPDGFTVGTNDGAAAGQTVMHAHVHVIPRHHGDVPDPRGGVRWVIPANAAYWQRET